MTVAFITATPPTPNGGLHVGHMAGPYIAADVLRRHLIALSIDAVMTTAMDDHQTYCQTAGLRDGRSAEDVADANGDLIEDTWRAAGVMFDVSVRPRRDPEHPALARAFFRALYDAGHLVARTLPVPWCASCEHWLVEAFVKGACPHCGASSGGNACEACGRPNHCGDLVDPHCVVCGSEGELREIERLFFPLARFEDELVAFWAQTRMPPHLRALCEAMLADGLPEIAVTQPADWGIGVPVDGYEDQRIYVWFEMAPGYLHEARRGGEAAGVHPARLTHDADVPFVQFFGFDNGYFHALLFPAAFRAYDPGIRLPTRFVVNEFYRLEGLKFSTSRRHAVWAADLLRDESPDVVRWHVLSDRPEGRQTNFTLDALAATRARLEELWDGWISRLLGACDGEVPVERPAGPEWEALRTSLLATASELRAAYSVEGFDPRRAARLLEAMLSSVADFGYAHEHAAGVAPLRGLHRAALTAQLTALQALAACSAPLAPGIAERVAAITGYAGPMTADAVALTPPAAGRPLAAPAGSVLDAAPAPADAPDSDRNTRRRHGLGTRRRAGQRADGARASTGTAAGARSARVAASNHG